MKYTNLLLSFLAALVGILIVIFPQNSIQFVVIILGIAALVKGLLDILKVRTVSEDSVFKRTVVLRGILSIVMGLVAITLPIALFNTAQAVVRILLHILALYMLICALGSFVLTVRLNAEGVPSHFYMMECIWSLLIAVILFVLARINLASLIRGAGVIIVIAALVFGVYSFKNPAVIIEPDSVEDDTEPQA